MKSEKMGKNFFLKKKPHHLIKIPLLIQLFLGPGIRTWFRHVGLKTFNT